MPGRTLPAWLGDRVGHFNVITTCCLLTAIDILALWLPFDHYPSHAGLIAFALLYGFVSGAFVSLLNRITNRLGPCLWLEAGSAFPITSLVRRALHKGSRSERTGFAPVDLGRNNYWQNVAQVTLALWTVGHHVCPLPLAGFSPKDFAWLDSPPYQFTKTKYWIRWQPVPQGVKSIAQALVAVPAKSLELLRRIADANTDAMFIVDPTHSVFDLSVRGHALVRQSLASAGLYFELAIRAATLLDTASNQLVPSIQQLGILSPLSLKPEGGLLVSVAGGSKFVVFSCPADAAGGPSPRGIRTVHASGVVSLIGEKSVSDSLRSFDHLIGISRYNVIAANPAAYRLSGNILYAVFGQVVSYAPYYQGLRNAVASDGEAIGDVLMP